MKAVLQRVNNASVRVNGEIVGAIGHGLVVLVGVSKGDSETDAIWLAEKTANLRIFSDEDGKFNRSLLDVGGEALVVSQFTLLADARKGRRPNFVEAAPPEEAEALVERFVQLMRDTGVNVETGRFQAHMHVELVNDGPVTIIIESKK